MADIITKDSEEFKELTGWIRRAGKAVEEATARIRPTIADEHYLTGDDVCERLHISRRTLQTLRDENMVSYTTIGGKILYPESGLYEVLKKELPGFPKVQEIKKRQKECPSGLPAERAFLLVGIRRPVCKHGLSSRKVCRYLRPLSD